jgi:uncharacterized protein (DUF433 family)
MESQELQQKLTELLDRLRRLDESREASSSRRWYYLVERSHPWRRQLCVKGRNMTVGQLVSTVRANRLTPEQASEDLELPLPAIYEALAYHAENQGLIDLEACEERRRLLERGVALEPKTVPG